MRTVPLGDGIAVPLLTVKDMIAVAEAAYEYERQTLLANLEAVGMPAHERLEELQRLATRRGSTYMVLMATYRVRDAADIVQRAAAAAGHDATQALARMTPRQLTDTAQALCGYEQADPTQPGQATGTSLSSGSAPRP
jgi:hypothetical protein